MINLCFLLGSSLVRSPFKLRINLEKSCIHLVGRVEMGLQLATESGCNLGSLLIDYLGLPLGAKHKSFAVWDKGKKDTVRDWSFRSDNKFLRVVGLLPSRAPSPACLPIFFPFFIPQRELGRD